jgi:hypothetical protein
MIKPERNSKIIRLEIILIARESKIWIYFDSAIISEDIFDFCPKMSINVINTNRITKVGKII